MRKQFAEYFPPSEDETDAIWREAIFVFDTNVLFDTTQALKSNCSPLRRWY